MALQYHRRERNTGYDTVPWSLGSCRGEPLEKWFFVEAWGERPARDIKRDVAHCRSVCGRCPIQPGCLDYALRSGVYGFWGGKTLGERRRLKKRVRDRRSLQRKKAEQQEVA